MYRFTEQLLDRLKAEGVLSVEIEAHDPQEPECEDWVWIIQYRNGGSDEGEYLSICPVHPETNEWFVSHNSAHAYGGNPTHDTQSGTIENIMEDVVRFFIARQQILAENSK